MIEISGSLFDAPDGAILVHACNAKGVWGSGIAASFKHMMPKAYIDYSEYCNRVTSSLPNVGSCFISPLRPCSNGRHYRVACLITSNGYGKDVDSPQDILRATDDALNDFISQYKDMEENLIKDTALICSNKFNSGLFHVPWEKTKRLIVAHCSKLAVSWVVYAG